MSEQPPELLNRSVVVSDLGTYRLGRLLGSGHTSEVYQGELVESWEGAAPAPSEAAIKVLRAHATEDIERRFTGEFETLQALNRQDNASRFFPKAYTCKKSRIADVDERWVLVQEMIPDSYQPLGTLQEKYPLWRMPEPLALSIGYQYLQVLYAVHEAKLSCRDRKKGDIRWQPAPDVGDLKGWQTWWSGTDWQTLGSLKVLDWNVVGGAGSQAVDIFLFGKFWFELLLGFPPDTREISIREGESRSPWILVGEWSKQPGWDSISYSTQLLLRNAIESATSNSVDDLKMQVKAAIEWWRRSPQDLEQVWRDDGHTDLKGRVTAADVDYLTRTRYSPKNDNPPSGLLDSRNDLHLDLRREIVQKFNDAIRHLKSEDYKEAKSGLECLDKLVEEPFDRLRAARLRQLAECQFRPSKLDDRLWRLLVDAADENDQDRRLTDASLNDLEQLRECLERGSNQASLLWSEIQLYWFVRKAQQSLAAGTLGEAKAHAEHAQSIWNTKIGKIQRFLQQVLNPLPDDLLKEINSKSRVEDHQRQAMEKLQSGIERAMALRFDEAIEQFYDGLRLSYELEQAQASEIAGALRDAIQIMEHWQAYWMRKPQVGQGQQLPGNKPPPPSLITCITYLAVWKERCSTAPYLRQLAGKLSLSDLVDPFLIQWKNEQVHLRLEVLNLLPDPLSNEAADRDRYIGWPVLQAYVDRFKDDRDLESEIKQRMDSYLEAFKQPLDELDANAQAKELQRYVGECKVRLRWAEYAHRLREMLDGEPQSYEVIQSVIDALTREKDKAEERYGRWENFNAAILRVLEQKAQNPQEELLNLAQKAQKGGWNYVLDEDYRLDLIVQWCEAVSQIKRGPQHFSKNEIEQLTIGQLVQIMRAFRTFLDLNKRLPRLNRWLSDTSLLSSVGLQGISSSLEARIDQINNMIRRLKYQPSADDLQKDINDLDSRLKELNDALESISDLPLSDSSSDAKPWHVQGILQLRKQLYTFLRSQYLMAMKAGFTKKRDELNQLRSHPKAFGELRIHLDCEIHAVEGSISEIETAINRAGGDKHD